MKKILFPISLAFICSVSSFAQQFTEGKLTYEPVTIDGTNGWKIVEPAEVITGELVIPCEVTHDGITKPVLEIGEEAFIVDSGEEYIKKRAERSEGITTLTFECGSQVKRIGDWAFYATSLQGTITLPATMKEIGLRAFDTANTLDVIRFEYGSQIALLNLSQFNTSTLYVPESVKTIDATNNGFSNFWYIANLYVAWKGSDILNPNYPTSVNGKGWPSIGAHAIHVPSGTQNDYRYWTTYVFDVQEIGLTEFKSIQKQYLDDYLRRALLHNPMGDYLTSYIQRTKQEIDNATSESQVLSKFQTFRTNLLNEYKADKVHAINSILNGVSNDYLESITQPVIAAINNSGTFDEVFAHYDGISAALEGCMTLYNQALNPTVEGEGMRMKITKNDDTVVEYPLSVDDAFGLEFTGSGNPIETQHYLDGCNITLSEEGDVFNLNVNGATATYPIDKVSKILLFRGTPTVSLRANEDPDHAGNFYTTFYSGLEAYTLPEGVKAYTAEVDGEDIVLTRIEGPLTSSGQVILPQGEAVLLYSDELQDGNFTMEIADPSSASPSTSNQFEGVDVATEQEAANYYMLSYGQYNLGFYKMGESMMLSANKAFIVQSPGAPAKAMRMVFADDVDGIESISSDSANSPIGIYSVSGIRLDKLQKGINIVNGKKVVVK